ncbi:helix-turn-helix domain-containing protein [Rossellomorea sp. GAMAL-10_SWC]
MLLNYLMNYHWQGNVRELENAIERAVVLCNGETLVIEDFPREIREMKNESLIESVNDDLPLTEILDQIERKYIVKALDDSLGQPAKAARKLGIS